MEPENRELPEMQTPPQERSGGDGVATDQTPDEAVGQGEAEGNTGPRLAAPKRGRFVMAVKNMWDKFRRRPRRRRPETLIPESPAPLPPRNVRPDEFISGLDPERRGYADGLRNDPPNPELRSGTGEIRIIGVINDKRREWERHANYWIRKYHENLHAVAAGPPQSMMQAITLEAKARMSDRAKQGDRELEELQGQRRDAKTTLDAESERYGITGTPEKGSDMLLHIMILLMVLLVEATLNGWFLGIRTTGILDGLVFAGGIALVNGLVGFLAGHPSRPYINRRDASWRIWGWTIIVIPAVILFFMNVLVGYYRDVLTDGELFNQDLGIANATRQALPKLRELKPMEDIQSYVMTLIGMAAALWAFIAGRLTSSPHPGYLHAYNNHQERRDMIKQEEDRARKDITDIRIQAHEKLRVEADKTAGSNAAATTTPLPDNARKARSDAQARIREWEDTGERAIQLYRSENERAREGNTAGFSWPAVAWDLLAIDEIREPAPMPARTVEPVNLNEYIEDIEAHYELLSRERPWLHQKKTPSG